MHPAVVRTVVHVEELERLAEAWEAIARGVPFREPTWLLTWWKHYGVGAAGRSAGRRAPEERRLFVQVVEREGRVIGLAPWFVERDPWQGRVVRSLGSGSVCSDYLTVLCQAGEETCVAVALAEQLLGPARGEWDRIDFDGVVIDDVTLAALFGELNGRGVTIDRRPSPHCWRIRFPAKWDDYLQTLSRSHRKRLRRLTKYVVDTPRVRWHTTSTLEEFVDDWPVFVDLHQRRWTSLGEPGCFADPRYTAFHEEVAVKLFLRGQLRLHILELDGRPAAAEYDLAGRTTVYAYQSGINPDLLDEQPGNLALIALLRDAQRQNFSVYDLLRGDESYKPHWGATPLTTENVSIVAPRLTSRLRYAAKRLLRASAQAASALFGRERAAPADFEFDDERREPRLPAMPEQAKPESIKPEPAKPSFVTT